MLTGSVTHSESRDRVRTVAVGHLQIASKPNHNSCKEKKRREKKMPMTTVHYHMEILQFGKEEKARKLSTFLFISFLLTFIELFDVFLSWSLNWLPKIEVQTGQRWSC